MDGSDLIETSDDNDQESAKGNGTLRTGDGRALYLIGFSVVAAIWANAILLVYFASR
jgi:hypothetical protein